MTMSSEIPDNRCAPDLAVDAGQPVIAIAHFGDGDPDEVDFAYTQPGSDRPYADDGYGQPRSKIARLRPHTYRYVIATEGFPAGDGEWRMTGRWDHALEGGYDTVVIRGRYHINSYTASLR